jgi:transglutaminase-like putative cysteine protease
MRHACASTLLCLAILLGGIATRAGAAAKAPAPASKYSIAKTPAWVVKVAEPASAPKAPADGGPTQVLLSDTQVSLLGARPVYYGHARHVARERSGLESVSTVNVAFNPHFETLTLHELCVLRDGRRIDKLGTARINVAQRERHLEEGVYDETVQAIIAIDDVRVGDIVEYAYSLAGDNPVFGGKYSQFFGLNRDVPVARLSLRITYPAGRKLYYKLHGTSLAVTEAARDGIGSLSLAAENLPAVRVEPAVPSWFLMYPALQVTEYESWDQLQQWAAGLYKTPGDLSSAIEQTLDQIRAEGGTPRELTARTLAWVQNQIRYYSVAVGTSSHRPNHPNVTFQQRFGDCKDKSVLLSAMLKKLGIDAEPALVSYQSQKGIADWLPTP